MIEFDEKYHKYIVKCSRNDTLIEMVNHIQELSMRFRYLYYDDEIAFEKMPKEHKHIMEPIVAGNAEQARQAMIDHIRDLKQFVVALGEIEQERKALASLRQPI